MKFLLYIFLFISSACSAQEFNCLESSANKSYFPLESTDTLYYATRGGRMLSWFDNERVEFYGELYKVQQIKYRNGKQKQFYYREANGVTYVYDKSSEKENVLIPAELKKGMKWESSDGIWKYKLVHLKSSYKTSNCFYTDLLEIKAEKKMGLKETCFLYFKKGVGLIGENKTGFANVKKSMIFQFVVPKEKEISERFCVAPHCENIKEIEGAKACVSKALGSYLKNLFVLKKNTVRGRYLIRILVDLDGSMAGVTVSEFPDGGEKTAKQLERIIQSYDRLKPAMVEGMIPVMCSMTLPINI